MSDSSSHPERPENTNTMAAKQRQMFETMARMQDEHNCQVHPQWREQGYEYYRAIWVECAELLDHYGWKWWKHQTPDLEQSRLELVDIWHFGLSELIRAQTPPDRALAAFASLPDAGSDSANSQEGAAGDAESFRVAVEELASQTLATRSFPLDAFVAALRVLPMSYAELFALYMGKNVLNRFRQTHGYKEGTYRKLWGGREDNEHLMEVVAEVPVGSSSYVDRLFSALEARYSAADPHSSS